jgi:hypothetical protein
MLLASSKRIKTTSVRSKKSVLETVRCKGMHTSVGNKSMPEAVKGKGMHISSSNVAAMGTQPSHAATVSKYKNIIYSLFAL